MKKQHIPWWPSKYELRRAWLVAFKTNIATLGPAVGVSGPEIAQFISFANAAIAAIDNEVNQGNLHESSIADRDTLVDNTMDFIKPIIAQMKTNPGFTPTIGETLDIIGETVEINPANVKPSLTLKVQPGFVRVRVRRNGADCVNLYMRRAGQANWTLVCRMNRATCDDTTPLANPGTPEIREYQVVAVIGDSEVGIPSDPKTVVYSANLAA